MANAPGLTQWLPLPYGPFGEFMRDPLGFQERARVRFGDIFRLRAGPILVHCLFHPDHVRRVLAEQQKIHQRGWHYRLVERLFGNNLVAAEGDYWMRQRRLAQPAFARQRLAAYADVMVDATAKALERWRPPHPQPLSPGGARGEMRPPHLQPLSPGGARGEIDVAPEMSRLALAIAGRTLFSRDVSEEADAVGSSFRVVGSYLEHRFWYPFTSLPSWVPSPRNVRFNRAVRTLNEIVLALVRERRREGRDVGDLLSMLIQARDEETGATMTDEQLRSEALTFLIAGHETTATALTWTAYLLASHPEEQQKVRDEAMAVLGDRPPTMADVPRLERARMVIEESLRLYPPIWAVVRQPVQDDEIGGYHIPARTNVIVCQYVTHRHPAFWERPDVFDPERFRVGNQHKGAYFPFLAGPHQCIGNEFAMLEMRIIVAMIVREFELSLQPGQTIVPRVSLVLKPNGPIRIALRQLRQPTVASA